MNLWVKALIILAVIWLGIAGSLWLVKKNTPTPDSLDAYIQQNPIETAEGEQRVTIIRTVERQLNRLDYQQRRQMASKRRQMDAFFRKLTPSEQEAFLSATLPSGFREMMEALNKMKPEQRKKVVERALEDMEKGDPEADSVRALDDPHVQQIIANGLSSFYRDANAETKMDFAPFIEAVQARMQNLR